MKMQLLINDLQPKVISRAGGIFYGGKHYFPARLLACLNVRQIMRNAWTKRKFAKFAVWLWRRLCGHGKAHLLIIYPAVCWPSASPAITSRRHFLERLHFVTAL